MMEYFWAWRALYWRIPLYKMSLFKGIESSRWWFIIIWWHLTLLFRYSLLLDDGSITSSANRTFFLLLNFSDPVSNRENDEFRRKKVKKVNDSYERTNVTGDFEFNLLHEVGEQAFVDLIGEKNDAAGDGEDRHEP